MIVALAGPIGIVLILVVAGAIGIGLALVVDKVLQTKDRSE